MLIINSILNHVESTARRIIVSSAMAVWFFFIGLFCSLIVIIFSSSLLNPLNHCSRLAGRFLYLRGISSASFNPLCTAKSFQFGNPGLRIIFLSIKLGGFIRIPLSWFASSSLILRLFFGYSTRPCLMDWSLVGWTSSQIL